MAFVKEGIMGMVSRACTREWPDGLAYLVVQNLMKKYRPTDVLSKVELRQRLNQITMKKDSDPSLLFEKLAAIQDRFLAPGMKIEEDELIAVVLDIAPIEYQSVLTSEQIIKKDALTLMDLEIVMGQHYRQINRKKSMRKAIDDELILSAFGGICFHCGKKGHRANQCPNRGESDGNEEKKKPKSFKKCLKCGKRGHLAKECWSKGSSKDEAQRGKKELSAAGTDKKSTEEYILCSTSDSKIDSNLWIADTGASVHMTPYFDKLTNVKTDNEVSKITMGNGTSEEVTISGEVVGMFQEGTNNEKLVRIRNVTYLKNGNINLFSISQMLKHGWALTGTNQGIKITKDSMVLTFGIKVHTSKGVLFAAKITDCSEVCGVAKQDLHPVMTADEAHEKLGHINNQAVKSTANKLGWKLTGKSSICEACTEGKARQKDIVSRNQLSEKHHDETCNQRIYLDISSVQNTEFMEFEIVRKPYWRIIVDERTGMKFSDFFQTKNGMVEPTCEVVNKWINSGINVNTIRCDDGGENKALEKRLNSSDWKLHLKFEYTGRNTPQRNHLAEVAFHTIANRGRAMMNHANVPRKYRFILRREAFKTATDLDGLVVVRIDNKEDTRYSHWNGTNPEFCKKLRVWGEAGAVKLKKQRSTKIEDRGLICMFVGYPESHSSDTYKMWNPQTCQLHITRDIRWLIRMFFSKKDQEVVAVPQTLIEGDESSSGIKSDTF